MYKWLWNGKNTVSKCRSKKYGNGKRNLFEDFYKVKYEKVYVISFFLKIGLVEA